MRINQVSTMNLGGADKPIEKVKVQEASSVNTNVAVKSSSPQLPQHTLQSDIGVEQASEEMPQELVDKAVQQANKNLAKDNRVIERSIHEVTKQVMYTVKDTVTGEIISEFPPKRIQDMIAKMWELAGLFVDEKA